MTIHNAGRVGNQHFFFPLGFFGWIFFFVCFASYPAPFFFERISAALSHNDAAGHLVSSVVKREQAGTAT